ncbi:uncharacterized protein [Oscarella lobularis]|uniref:uncharacterized protein n=1 Tax=Oscarella lobularis TaxID=121494 RepID=UPI003313DFC4
MQQWRSFFACIGLLFHVVSLSDGKRGDYRLAHDANSSNNASDALDWELHRLHGTFMCLAWFGFIPWAVFIARYLRSLYPKGWFQAHRAAALTAVLLISCSLGLIAYAHRHEGFPIEPHTLCGIFAISLAFLQPVVAFMRPNPTLPDGRPHPRRWLFNWMHRLIALIASVLALSALFTGIAMVQVYGFPSTLAAPISFLILLFIFGFIAEAAHQGYIVFPSKLEYQKMRGKSYDAMTTSAEEDEELEDSAQDDDDAEASYRNEKRERSSSARLYVKAKQFWLGLFSAWVAICAVVAVSLAVCVLKTPNNGNG